MFIDPVTEAVEKQLTSTYPYLGKTEEGEPIKKRRMKPPKIFLKMISELEKTGKIQTGKKRRKRRRGRTERSRAFAGGIIFTINKKCY